MKIRELTIENFRAIRNATFSDLNDLVVIAGPNGVGKTCVFDAIRLLKSTFGGYQPNEVSSWFNEFQLNLSQDPGHITRLLRDSTKSLRISASVELAQSEREYLRANGERRIREMIWERLIPNAGEAHANRSPSLVPEMRTREPQFEEIFNRAWPEFLARLDEPLSRAAVSISPQGEDTYEDNPVLEVLWGTFDPENLGIIDFHSASRVYNYEQIGSINLNVRENKHRVRNHSLYQTQNKYSNIKSEMTSSYVRELIVREAGVSPPPGTTLMDSLRELFRHFFPDKEFLGPHPLADGSISFQVKLLADGTTHDIDFLSSGEKEVLFGYLRLRNNAPRNSVLLIDEPELHLNPSLVRGLPGFYQKHVGGALHNQVWLITHSDACLRESRTLVDTSIWHMRPPPGDGNQAQELESEGDVAAAVYDLIGDLAAYRPGASVLFVEGSNSEFDRYMIEQLFPEFALTVNIVSAGPRTAVEKVNSLLQAATEAVGLETRFFAITDSDSIAPKDGDVQPRRWDVYHIENYLLDTDYLYEAATELMGPRPQFKSPSEVDALLLDIAHGQISAAVRRSLTNDVHRRLMALSTIKIDKGSEIALAVNQVLKDAHRDLEAQLGAEFSESSLLRRKHQLTEVFTKQVQDGEWRQSLPGRSILREFASRLRAKPKYEQLRNLVLAQMARKNHQPPGMKRLLDEVLVEARK